MRVAYLFLMVSPIAALTCGLLFQGCVGGSSGGGGIAAVDTNDAPAPVSTQFQTKVAGIPASSALHPEPYSNSQYDLLREGWATLSSSTVTVREDNGIQLAVVAFNANNNLAPAIAYCGELEVIGLDVNGAQIFRHHEDFRTKQPSDPIAGAWYANTPQKWFDRQVSSSVLGNFGHLTNAAGVRYWAVSPVFGVPMYIGDPNNPQQRDQVAHIFFSDFPRKSLPLGVVTLRIRVRFSLFGGAMLYFLLDRWPDVNGTVQNQQQAQTDVEQVVTSDTYYANGSGENYNITIEVPVEVLPTSQPNPIRKDPVFGITELMDVSYLRD